MKCLYPQEIYVTDKVTKKNKKQIVPCGKCVACRSNIRQQWFIRLKYEQEKADASYFITLTYDDSKLPIFIDRGSGDCTPAVNKRDCQLFMKRLRKSISKISPNTSVKYYLSSEYGPNTNRPHYHLILFMYGCDPSYFDKEMANVVHRAWHLGNVVVACSNDATCNYTTKDLLKFDAEPWTLWEKQMFNKYGTLPPRQD